MAEDEHVVGEEIHQHAGDSDEQHGPRRAMCVEKALQRHEDVLREERPDGGVDEDVGESDELGVLTHPRVDGADIPGEWKQQHEQDHREPDARAHSAADDAPVAVGVCAPRPVKGPGDCGRTKDGASKLTTADASGSGTAQIIIPEGPLGNQTPPSVSCPPCELRATNIANQQESAKVKLNYASDSSGGGNNAPKQGGGGNNQNAAPDQDLANTGPRETLIMNLMLKRPPGNRFPDSDRAAGAAGVTGRLTVVCE